MPEDDHRKSITATPDGRLRVVHQDLVVDCDEVAIYHDDGLVARVHPNRITTYSEVVMVTRDRNAPKEAATP